jgi:cytochrome c biogenesis protein CcdA
VQHDLVGLAFAAGLVAALNPCGFAMLPAYLTLVVRNADGGVVVSVGRAVAATCAMALGFLAVFGTFGLLTVSLASTVQRWTPYATIFIGVLLVLAGTVLLAGRELTLLLPNRLRRSVSRAPTHQLGSMFGYGVGYAIASLSCTVGPFLAVTGAGVGSASTLIRIWIYVAYTAGFALVIGALAVGAALAGTAVVERLRRILPHANRIGGAVLVIVGLYVAYYGYYEVRLFTDGGNTSDPVVGAAGRLQSAVAGWVYRHGPTPWIVLLAMLVAGAAVWARRGRKAATSGNRPSHEDPATAGDAP